jgi:hypothetical protein
MTQARLITTSMTLLTLDETDKWLTFSLESLPSQVDAASANILTCKRSKSLPAASMRWAQTHRWQRRRSLPNPAFNNSQPSLSSTVVKLETPESGEFMVGPGSGVWPG